VQCDGRLPGAPLAKSIGYYLDDDMEYWDPLSGMMTQEKVFAPAPTGQPAVHLDLAYHFENERFVNFLEGYAQAVGCRVLDDTVAQVLQDDHGVAGLVLKSGRTETADLYVDASGFASLLLGKTLGEPFVPFKSSLFCDRAVVGGWARTSEPIHPYTTCETMPSGWCWQIEHENRINRGYVYSSDFIADDAAEAEFRATAPKVGPTRIVKFVSGRSRDGWVKNVVGVGNSSAFVEPLEATALGLIAIQCRLLVGTLVDSDRRVPQTQLREFNKHHHRIWDNVRGFIAMHYKLNTRSDTPFWRACRADADLAGAAEVVEYYAENGPSNFWAPTLLDPVEPFKMGGYATLLTGMKVPYRRVHQPTDAEVQWVRQWRERNRRIADRALTVRQALDAAHRPDWAWGNWSTSKALYVG
jgi:tryptophan halogenase